ncbi:MAG: hypothetical protein OES25_13825 [Acidobacteriota bacterium]|nr:hypothetical protein [Acidobacteriota bacterium]
MKQANTYLEAVFVGGIAGIVVLGLVGRIATAVVAQAMGQPTNFTLSGLLEVTVVGAVVGALGGALFLFLRERLTFPGLMPAIVVGAVVFAASIFVPWLSGRMELATLGASPATLVVAALVCLGYGVTVHGILARLR